MLGTDNVFVAIKKAKDHVDKLL